jgi:hypothetical protein
MPEIFLSKKLNKGLEKTLDMSQIGSEIPAAVGWTHRGCYEIAT